MVGGSLRVLQLLPYLKLVTMILLKVALNTKNQSINLKKLLVFVEDQNKYVIIFVGIKY
jgi:hypothetical protein